MHVVPPAIRIVVVPVGVIVMLGLCYPLLVLIKR
jgi:hypothetical protein